MISFQPVEVSGCLFIAAKCVCNTCKAECDIVMTMSKQGRQVRLEVYEHPEGWLVELTNATCPSCVQNRSSILDFGAENFYSMSLEERLQFLKTLPEDQKSAIHERLRNAISQLKSLKSIQPQAAE